jgi:hypothetical protein
MKLADLDFASQAFVRHLLARAGYDLADYELAIGPGDEMFFKGVLPGYPGRPGVAFFRYVESALRTFEVYRQLAGHLGGFAALGPVLDFGSGWGRLTRTLSRHLPPERIWACDIYPDAVAWQAETFGVNGLASVTDPGHFAFRQPCSIVFVASVFSHLPDGLFQRWLERLYALVAPNGLLAFSVHGAAFAPEGQAISEEGIGYAYWSESATLDPTIYGMSYVTEAYVARAIAEATAGAGYKVFPRALFESQDLYVVAGRGVDLSGLEVVAAPIGGFNGRGVKRPGWDGWGVEPNVGAQVVRADLYVDDVLLRSMAPSADHEEVRRYFPGTPNMPVRWRFDAPELSPSALVRVELTSSTGRSTTCYAMKASDGPGVVAI